MSAYDPKRTLGLIATLIGGVAAARPLAARAQEPEPRLLLTGGFKSKIHVA
jgi:hypothetical protein